MQIKTIVVLFIFLASIHSYANDVTPLGQTIGKSTIDDLKNSKCPVVGQGINKFSNGQMFANDGSCYGIQGLKKVLFVYNPSGVLEGALLTFNNSQFQSVVSSLNQKYSHKTKEQIPFVGDKHIVWEEGKVDIELKSPHMSFDMDLLYVTKALNKKFKQEVKNDEQQQKTQQTNQL